MTRAFGQLLGNCLDQQGENMGTQVSMIRYLRFVLHGETDGYLMAKKRPGSPALPLPEIKELRTLLRVLVSHGVRKIRVTGDDPALREDLPEVVQMLGEISGIKEVALTTRGMGLKGRVKELSKRGLGSVNFSLDTLRPERYKKLNKGSNFDDVWGAVEETIAAGLKVKFNVVVRRKINDDEVSDFIALTHKQPVHVRLLEWNTSTETVARPRDFVSTREVMAAIKPPLVPHTPSNMDGPALIYAIPGHAGTIGFIPNITEHFCDSCTRIGLTDKGEILSCIFGHGLSLARHLRSPGGAASVSAFIDRVLRRKFLLAAKLSGFTGAVPASDRVGAAHVAI